LTELRPSEAARQAFGIRLRDLRKGAGLSGADLGALTGMHKSKISRAENAKFSLSEADVRAWAVACRAEDQVPELIAAHREVEQMWLEYRRELKLGMKHIQARSLPLFERTKLLRCYESLFIPGYLQTLGYATAQMTVHAHMHGLSTRDVPEAAANRLKRQALITGRSAHLFAFVLEANALHTMLGSLEVMQEQLDFLSAVTRNVKVALGIIPFGAQRTYVFPGEGFYIFDSAQVRQEFWSGMLRTSQRDDIAYFLKSFELLKDQAVFGDAARAQIEDARGRLQQGATP
jgi:transcriptional regulator with XRE-family HTH domain